MVAVGRSADARHERRWHLAVPMLMGAGGLIVAASFATNPVIALMGLTLATNNTREFGRIQGLRIENWTEPVN